MDIDTKRDMWKYHDKMIARRATVFLIVEGVFLIVLSSFVVSYPYVGAIRLHWTYFAKSIVAIWVATWLVTKFLRILALQTTRDMSARAKWAVSFVESANQADIDLAPEYLTDPAETESARTPSKGNEERYFDDEDRPSQSLADTMKVCVPLNPFLAGCATVYLIILCIMAISIA